MSHARTVSVALNWQLNGPIAKVANRSISGRCNTLFPADGVHIVGVDGVPLEGIRLLGPDFPNSDSATGSSDVYARGGDLVAIYSPTNEQPFRSQAYWRLASHDLTSNAGNALAAIELVASKQTDLLDSRPDLCVSSHLPQSSVWRLQLNGDQFVEADLDQPQSFGADDGLSCFLFRIRGGQFSYAEMVYPLDFENTQIQTTNNGNELETRHHLFGHRLEKGVILRARVLGLILPRSGDLQIAAAHYAMFAASEPPLTT